MPKEKTFYTRHDLSSLFRDLTDNEYQELKNDIKNKGILNKEIIIYQNQILDGWHRYKIASELNLLDTIDFVQLPSSINPSDYVISQNIHRRHLTASQRAQIVVEVSEYRKKRGGDRKTQVFSSSKRNLKSTQQLAKTAQVGPASIDRAKQVSELGRAQEVISGEKSAGEIIQQEREKREKAERELQALKDKKQNKYLGSTTGEYEWYTPKEYIDAVQAVLGEIDLDPASSEKANEIVQAEKIYTKQDNGLNKKWAGKVFMNPPFKSELINQFVPKLINHYLSNDISEAILLTDTCSETAWFQQALETSTAHCHPKSRLKFYDPEGKTQSAQRPQTFFYFGNNPTKFCEIFSSKGYTTINSRDLQEYETVLQGYRNSFVDDQDLPDDKLSELNAYLSLVFMPINDLTAFTHELRNRQ
ncbi:MAG: DNA N-6-adenine-methyltransferase [Candidatus Poribacteria bacterium]|nr:DNA N-6-adenine-methyltransferase [Candidatus Poribacteria bacterium]